MSMKHKYFSINKIEKLKPLGDASRFLIEYSTADDEKGKSNRLDKSIIVGLSRGSAKHASLITDDEKEKAVVEYFHKMIESAIFKNEELPPEKTITPYDSEFLPKKEAQGLIIGQWNEVAIEKGMGFLE